MIFTAESARLPISDAEIDALYVEHGRLGHDEPSGQHDGECSGCLALEQLELANKRARQTAHQR